MLSLFSIIFTVVWGIVPLLTMTSLFISALKSFHDGNKKNFIPLLPAIMKIIYHLAERSQFSDIHLSAGILFSLLLSQKHSIKTNLGIGNRLEFRSGATVSGHFSTALRRPVSCSLVTGGSSGLVVAQDNVSQRCLSLWLRGYRARWWTQLFPGERRKPLEAYNTCARARTQTLN